METSELSRAEIEDKVIRRAWESKAFKDKLFTHPKEALEEIGVNLMADIEVVVHEEHRKKMVLVIPVNPLERMNEYVAGSIPPPGGPQVQTKDCASYYLCPFETKVGCESKVTQVCPEHITKTCEPSKEPGPASPQKP
jgi:hypothetical protein